MIHSNNRGRATAILVFLPMILVGQRPQEVPVKNWPTALYWKANQAEREAAAKPVPELQFSTNAVSTDALTFVAVTPCRLVDTRGAAVGFDGIAPFDGPAIAAAATLTIPVQSSSEASTNTAPAPCGVIPTIAKAYSLNLTVVPASAGAINYISLWPAGATQPVVSTLNDVQGGIVSNSAIVPAGTPNGGVSVYNAGPATVNVIIDMNGYYAAPTDLNNNTAIGSGTLASNTTGNDNTASGYYALSANTTGSLNTANGYAALISNTIGTANTAIGYGALLYNNGNFNTAVGFYSLFGNTTGINNTAMGYDALGAITTGANNIALGYYAAENLSGASSNNIEIGSQGSAGESGAIRIGTSGTQTSFFAAGVRGATTGVNNAVPVVIDSNGQMGTVNSSRRFKEDIQAMGNASSGLLRLRPVTYRYTQPYDNGSKPIDYGLIAEEVDEVYPDLVARNKDGQIETVQYQKLTPMLLNEVQKQAEQIRAQAEHNREQAEQNRQQVEQIRSLEERLAALEALLPKVPEQVR